MGQTARAFTRPLFVAVALAANASPLAYAGGLLPTKDELEATLTVSRFDDSCDDAAAASGCPPINIYSVVVRRLACREEPRIPSAGGTDRGVACRFQSAVVTPRSRPQRWTWEEVRLRRRPPSRDCDGQYDRQRVAC